MQREKQNHSITTELIYPQVLFPNVMALFKAVHPGTTDADRHPLHPVGHFQAPKFWSERGSPNSHPWNPPLLPPNPHGALLKFMELHMGVHVCPGKSLASLGL